MRGILLALLLLASGSVFAQPYPSKPIRVAVAFPPGGPVDIIARLLGPKLSDSLGQSVVVENVVGAGGNVAATRVAKSAPDGYTILAHSSAYAVNPTLIPNAGYDGEKDFIPLAIVASQPNFVVVHADFPAKTLAELIARAKTDKLAFASAGNGTTPHLTGENLFKLRAKVDITHIPFKGGGPAAAAVLSGQPPVGVIAGSAPLPHIKAGKIRALAVSSAQRVASLPEVPTLGELGYPGMEDYTWVGFFLPAGTPPDIAQKLNDAIRRAAADPVIKERMEGLAFDVTAAPLAETAAYVKSELAKWGKVVREVGAKVD
ncbi:MAG TPA: tripartite tricarboxylate transporter substrate binding protein [Burkholderiales bacterium]|nr:tripartite tricarboxylate transporter substrate binding protein [Burkholderiales bacterium]